MYRMRRAGDLKGEPVSFAMSERFDSTLGGLVEDAFPAGSWTTRAGSPPSSRASCSTTGSTTGSRGGDLVVARFVASRRELPEEDKALLLGWRDPVQGLFEITEPYGPDTPSPNKRSRIPS
ncbi:hypothetical protein [Actinomadura sp. WMMB 499]|uniref:hypothetical protein n=1 Tax=Actinomadura sp. WMMB 499 TaxID=1219491 RepID=UPI001243C5D9|nr:hypothetical protein [Actinomadura sp. WMMB 499]QFG22560.1 hypothetical protein F7P10_16995 [Actinomadura sp. WMMB 499]